MLTWIIQISLISIIFIFLIHNIFCFLKNTLTIPKVHDLVNNSKKYENIYSIILNNNPDLYQEPNQEQNQYKSNNLDINSSCTEIDLLPNTNTTNSNTFSNSNINNNFISESNMKNELKSFLKSQLYENENENENIISNNITIEKKQDKSNIELEVREFENNNNLLSENFSYL